MNVAAIEQTIRAMCAEVEATRDPKPDWRLLTEDDLFCEAAVCIFSSQIVFEVALAMVDRLRNWGLLRVSGLAIDTGDFEIGIKAALSEPVWIESGGEPRQVMPRFRNRLASLLTTTVLEIYGRGESFHSILLSSTSAHRARETLIGRVWGFGPKQASLFLQRIGYCSELAVLDTHVLDYLRITRGFHCKPGALSQLGFYERVEEGFREIAADFGYSTGCVDLATWVTMRVAKREAML